MQGDVGYALQTLHSDYVLDDVLFIRLEWLHFLRRHYLLLVVHQLHVSVEYLMRRLVSDKYLYGFPFVMAVIVGSKLYNQFIFFLCESYMHGFVL